MNRKDLFRKKTLASMHKDMAYVEGQTRLVRNLGLKDLTFMGIAAIIGAGIFSTIGNASFQGGPAVTLLFVFTAIACAFSAMCYAEFASVVPVSGSAYTYAYVAFGEVIAWIIGWTLIVEYAIGNIAVAISWSDYFTGLFHGITGIQIPEYLSMDYLSASRGFDQVQTELSSGKTLSELPGFLHDAYMAWSTAPSLGSLKVILDIPALAIVFIITWLVYRGIHESKTAANLFVYLKLGVILLVIVAGAFYVDTDNWSPFAPNGVSGVLKGVSAVFFAYIGFDALSTTSEECINPQRDLPKSMMYVLIICTILYVFITLILTGMVPYTELAVGDPLSFVFERVGVQWISGLVAASAVVAMASVLLVFQLGQPRIWMTMSRDGLLPKKFSKLHPKYKTPAFSTIITGFLVAIPALFMNLQEVTDLVSIGTLFAFVLVCGGVLNLHHDPNVEKTGFRVPFIASRVYLPLLMIAVLTFLLYFNVEGVLNFFDFNGGWEVFKHKIPMLSFIIVSIGLTFRAIQRNLSLIPIVGLLINFYLMTELGITNWTFFGIWLVLGLFVYFGYSVRKSRLAKPQAS
ncbi:MAG: amino acid permease [Bacteroidia bacterium]